tara:strand:+ start:13079 stop:14101 length:1023 start_codon:yes stop_codon:yes gene_type:complete
MCLSLLVRKFLVVLISTCWVIPIYAQIGGNAIFQFANLNTSPRATALGGYLTALSDNDVNAGIYNPGSINIDMNNNIVLNYTDYYSDIIYGDFGYCFNIRERSFITSLKFIDYGTFLETNEFGQELGTFRAAEYLFSVGSAEFLSDSLFSIGVNTKFAYSSLYDLSSFGLLLDLGLLYRFPNNNLAATILLKNMGYQITSYYENNREDLPFEIIFGLSSKLTHIPFRWHLTFQHLEIPDLGFVNDYVSASVDYDSFGYNVLRHIVFGGEFFLHKNVTFLFGYNNRRRFEMIIEDRKALVGFSCGFSLNINRFNITYSRTSNHFSRPISSFGISTNLKKID